MKTWELTPQEITAYDAALMDHHRCRRSRITIGPMGGPNRFPVQISGQEDFFLVEEVATGERWIWFCCNTCGAIRPLTHPTAPASWREFNVKQEYSIPESNMITTSDNRIILKYLEKEDTVPSTLLNDDTFEDFCIIYSPPDGTLSPAIVRHCGKHQHGAGMAAQQAKEHPGRVFFIMNPTNSCQLFTSMKWREPAR